MFKQTKREEAKKERRKTKERGSIQFSSVPLPIGSWGDTTDSTEIPVQPFLQKVDVSNSGISRDVHSLTLSSSISSSDHGRGEGSYRGRGEGVKKNHKKLPNKRTKTGPDYAIRDDDC